MGASARPARSALAVALLTGIAIFAYGNALDLPFLFDDYPAIERNPTIRSLSARAIFSPPRDTPVAGRPLVNASLAINYALGGLEPRGYHVFNLAVHLACGLLLFALVRRTLFASAATAALRDDATGIATAVSAVWLVHPLGSECVDYVTQRTESMMALLYLSTLYGVAGAATAPRLWARRAYGAGAVAACALGMLTKETMVSAPVVTLLYDAVFLGGSFRAALRRRPLLYTGLAATLLLLLGLLAGAPRSRSVGASLGVTPWSYLLNQAWVVSEYLQRVVWPHPLILDYGWPRPLELRDVLLDGVFVSAVALVTLVVAWRRPALGFPALAAFLILAPTSSIVPIVTEVGTERRMYLPLAGLLIPIVLGCRVILARIPTRSTRVRVGAAALCIAVLTLGVVTRARNREYRSEEQIWRSVVSVLPENPRAILNLGEALRKRGALDEAEALFVEALALHPVYGRAEAHRALVALDRGDRELAETRMRQALALEPRLGDVRSNLGEILHQSGRSEEAIAQWRTALDLDPELVFAANNLAWVLATHPDPRLRDPESALAWAQRANLQSAGTDPGVLDTLAAAYAASGRWEAAADAARRGIAMAESRGDDALAGEIGTRLDRYLSGAPHRAEPTPRARPALP